MTSLATVTALEARDARAERLAQMYDGMIRSRLWRSVSVVGDSIVAVYVRDGSAWLWDENTGFQMITNGRIR